MTCSRGSWCGPSTRCRFPASRVRHLAPGRLQIHRRGQHLVEFFDRRKTRHRLLPDRFPHLRHVRRPAERRRTCSATACWRWMCAPGNGSGTSRLIHHDLWDYDHCNEPKLLTVNHDGKKVDIVAMGTKSGLLFVFNRVTGEPLWPIEERPVPKSDVPGEEAWPTQPFPTKPPPYLAAEDDGGRHEPVRRRRRKPRDLRKIFLAARHEGVYTPMTADRDQISMPGEYGGTNWAGTAGDPRDRHAVCAGRKLRHHPSPVREERWRGGRSREGLPSSRAAWSGRELLRILSRCRMKPA